MLMISLHGRPGSCAIADKLGDEMKNRSLWLMMLGWGVFSSPLIVHAELGASATSVQKDQARLHASLQTVRTPRYVVHEMTMPSGTVVREFVSPSGQVFGVSWAGQWRPDLRQLLGTYYDQYLQARQGHRAARGAVTVALPGLFVHMTGHPRAFAGFAYVPTLIPQDVRAEEIR
jgi:hypothetical protein